MGFRFNKRIKIAPGIKLNVGLGGISGSIGLAGTGLSYNKKLYDTRLKRQLSRQYEVKEHLSSINLELNKDTGHLLIFDTNGNEVCGRDKTLVFKMQETLIGEWLQEQVDDINEDTELLNNIHLDSPDINHHLDYEIKPYLTLKPSQPILCDYQPQPQHNKIPRLGFFARLFKSKKEEYIRKQKESYDQYETEMKQWQLHCADIDRNNKMKDAFYTQELAEWHDEKTSHDAIEQQIKHQFNIRILTDIELMNNILISTLEKMSWPRETQVDFQITNKGKTVWLDIDLPEIEDLPQKTAMVSVTGKKINVKMKSKKQLQLEYARHIHGIAVRLACFTLATLPNAVDVILSGYSQRISAGTGKISNDYLYSIHFTRTGLNELNFNKLENIDPIVTCALFDNIRKITATGTIKAIEPFSV